MTWIGNALVAVSAVLIAACVVAYQWTTRGAWRDTEHGRHLMAFMAVIAAVLALSVFRIIGVDILGEKDPAWFRALRVAVFCLVPAVFAWRLALILRAARRPGGNHQED